MAAVGVMAFAGVIVALSVSGHDAPPTLKILSGQIRAASHGALSAVRILPVPKGSRLPVSVVPVEVSDSGKSALIWVVSSGGKSLFFPGSAFDAAGVNLAIPLMRSILSTGAVPTSYPSSAVPPAGGSAKSSAGASIQNIVDSTAGFLWAAPGHMQDKPNVVFFMDPNCIFCHREFEQMKPLVDAGKLVVRVVPVGFLKASSIGKAEAVLNGGVPAFLKNENGFDDGTEEGGIAPMNDAPDSQSVQSSTQLLSRLEGGRIATPFLLVRQGNSWRPHMGAMQGSDLIAMLSR